MPVPLEASDVVVRFAGLLALDGINLVLGEHEILGLIGPNGAGKTTLVNVLSGFHRPTRGRVLLAGQDITRWSADRIGRTGVARTFQDVRLFRGMTVADNVELGLVGCGMRRWRAHDRGREILEWIGLADRASMLADALPYGDQRRLGMARALAARPSVLLLDEPAAGMNERESAELNRLVVRVREELSCAIVVIEHDMRLIFAACDRIQVLDHGRTLAVGPVQQVRQDAAVVEAYLGSEAVG